MNKLPVFLSAVAFVGALYAVPADKASNPTAKTPTPIAKEKNDPGVVKTSKESLMKTGGRIQRPGTGKGWVALVDLQGECPQDVIEKGAKRLTGYSDCITRYVKGSEALSKLPPLKLGEAALKETKANIALALVASPDLPPMLIAPEAHWGIVNVSALKADLPAGDLGKVLFEGRCRKETMRAFSILCGGAGSPYVGTVVNAATPQELDGLEEAIPFDNVQAYDNFIKKIGMTKRVTTTYRTACRQGWAPTPSNEWQKAVWDDVHALPKTPIEIKPEKK